MIFRGQVRSHEACSQTCQVCGGTVGAVLTANAFCFATRRWIQSIRSDSGLAAFSRTSPLPRKPVPRGVRSVGYAVGAVLTANAFCFATRRWIQSIRLDSGLAAFSRTSPLPRRPVPRDVRSVGGAVGAVLTANAFLLCNARVDSVDTLRVRACCALLLHRPSRPALHVAARAGSRCADAARTAPRCRPS